MGTFQPIELQYSVLATWWKYREPSVKIHYRVRYINITNHRQTAGWPSGKTLACSSEGPGFDPSPGQPFMSIIPAAGFGSDETLNLRSLYTVSMLRQVKEPTHGVNV